MNNCFIILAGGESKRFNSKIPKPYHIFRGKPLILHSIDKAKSYGKFNKIAVVLLADDQNFCYKNYNLSICINPQI